LLRAAHLISGCVLQEAELRDFMLEEHKKLYGPRNTRARGYSSAVLERMHNLYDPAKDPVNHQRIQRALPHTQAVLNKAAVLFKDGWPYVVEADNAAKAAAAQAAAVTAAVVSAGVHLPVANATSAVCLDWMAKFVQTEMVEKDKQWSFKTITKEQAQTIHARVLAWMSRTPSLQGRCESFLGKFSNAFRTNFSNL